MGGRLYDSRIGRVLQADPPFMESPFWSQGLNRYSYVFNNPLNAVDPSGFFSETEDDKEVSDSDEVIWDPTCQGPGCDEGGGGAGDSAGPDDEDETSPSEDPDDDEDASDYEEAESVSATDNGGVPEIPGFLDAIGGFGIGYAQGIVPGGTFLPMPPGSASYQLWVSIGQVMGGLQSIQNGSTLAGGGALASSTGVGAPGGAPVAVAGVGLAAGGAVNVAKGLDNIINIVEADDGGEVWTPNGGVDFSQSSALHPNHPPVQIEYTGSYPLDELAANQAAGIKSTPKGYTWHHLDDYNPATNQGTLQLVETSAHQANQPHNGGVAQYQQAKGVKYLGWW